MCQFKIGNMDLGSEEVMEVKEVCSALSKNPRRASHILENFGHLHIIKTTGEFLFIEQIMMPKFSTQYGRQ